MSSPLEQAGAVREPSEYATISMDRSMTGLWTQRSPLRDADVPYLYGKFYSASRFDSLIDGLNREMTSRLTSARRPGSSQYNTNAFPAINSFYSYKRIVNGVEVVRVMADGQDGVIYDATAGQKTSLFTKSAGAGKARFQGVNTSLFFTDGVENKKWLQPAQWAKSPLPTKVFSVQNSSLGGGLFQLAITTIGTIGVSVGDSVVIAGLTTALQFNGAVRTVASIIGTVVTMNPVIGGSAYASTPDTGTIVTFSTAAGILPQYEVGSTVIDSNGNLEYLISAQVGTVSDVQVIANSVSLTFSATNFGIVQGRSFTLSGLGGAAFLNGKLLIATSVVPSGAVFLVTASFAHAPYAFAADSGTATTVDIGTPTTTGSTAPTWNTLQTGSTTDGASTWVNFGYPVYDWGAPPAPVVSPTLTPISNGTGMVFWQPLTSYAQNSLLLDSAGNIISANTPGGSPGISGVSLPKFELSFTGNNPVDGSIRWVGNQWLGAGTGTGGGTPSSWLPGVTPGTRGALAGGAIVILDTNGNIQYASGGVGATGASQPSWNTTYGGTTTDNGVVWTNAGPYIPLAFQGSRYGYAFHCIDGSVSTLSPLSPLSNGVIDGLVVGGYGSGSSQVDSIWIFRTADGQSTPLFLASIPNPGAGVRWTFTDQFQDSLLIPELPGPQSDSNDPPPVGMTAPIYHLGRMWAIYKNTVVNSGGPDTLVGNGNTSFPPLNSFPCPEQPIRLIPVTMNNGGVLVVCSANTYVILGNGTASNPFTAPQIYEAGVGIASYDAMTVVGSTLYFMTGKGKVASFDPGAGYIEYGFPIGDQFKNVTTGGGGKIPSGAPLGALYSPASTFVSWVEISSGDTAVYIADGAVGWFRYSPVASPETGYMWSPRAVIVGGTSAVQAVETSPGITQLLIGPASSGPILFRDSTVSQDYSAGGYHSYPSYDVKGNIVLCQSGEVAEIAHIGVKSIATGARPWIGLLLGEISSTLEVPFDWLSRTSCDPPDLPPSTTLYSDRYTALQNGVCPKCDNFQLAIDYGTQNAPDEMLMFSVYGAKHAERKQQ